jgi:hypothetical protein
MKVHIFWAVSSPTCCNYALKKTAEEHGNDYDQSIQNTITNNMYVDDSLASVATEEKVKYLIKNLMALCKQGGFRLTKWLSNNKEVLKSIPEEDRAEDIKKFSLSEETLIERALEVYWFVEDDSLGFFVMGKSRVAPLKAMTIPRMELAAATQAVKLSRLVDEQLDFPIEKIHFWTDSTTVLRYIANTKTRFQTFVANRLVIISAHTTFDQWHYLNTKKYPADCASTGVSVIGEFIDHQLWFHGPEIFWKPESTWLSNCDIDTAIGVNDVEVKKKCVNTTLDTVFLQWR